jgi:hypothetical protein
VKRVDTLLAPMRAVHVILIAAADARIAIISSREPRAHRSLPIIERDYLFGPDTLTVARNDLNDASRQRLLGNLTTGKVISAALPREVGLPDKRLLDVEAQFLENGIIGNLLLLTESSGQSTDKQTSQERLGIGGRSAFFNNQIRFRTPGDWRSGFRPWMKLSAPRIVLIPCPQ